MFRKLVLFNDISPRNTDLRMQLKTILNAIEKHKSFVYSEARWRKSQNGREIEFEVRPRSKSKPICSRCRKQRPGYDRLKVRRFGGGQKGPFYFNVKGRAKGAILL